MDRLRANGKAVLSLVAEEDGRIVGHILFSSVMVETAGAPAKVLALAPMGVLPDRQRMGIGSQLVRQAVDKHRHAVHRGIVALGHPKYYPRFGFVPADSFGLRCEYDAPSGAFMALELVPGGLTGCAGLVTFAPELAEAARSACRYPAKQCRDFRAVIALTSPVRPACKSPCLTC